jgi:hypothetical protein
VLRNFAGNEHQALNVSSAAAARPTCRIDVAAAALERGDV